MALPPSIGSYHIQPSAPTVGAAGTPMVVHTVGLTLFVGANLLQSAFTNWCPMMAILRRAGFQG